MYSDPLAASVDAPGEGAVPVVLLPEAAGAAEESPAEGAQAATVPASDRPAIPAKTLLRTDGLIKALISVKCLGGAYGGVNVGSSVLVQPVVRSAVSCGFPACKTAPIPLLSLAPGRLEG